MITDALPVIVSSGGGDALYACGEEVTVHLGGAQTGQDFAKPGGPDMQRIVAISAEQGIHH